MFQRILLDWFNWNHLRLSLHWHIQSCILSVRGSDFSGRLRLEEFHRGGIEKAKRNIYKVCRKLNHMTSWFSNWDSNLHIYCNSRFRRMTGVEACRIWWPRGLFQVFQIIERSSPLFSILNETKITSTKFVYKLEAERERLQVETVATKGANKTRKTLSTIQQTYQY